MFLYKKRCADVQISITIRIQALRDISIQKIIYYIESIASYV